MGVDETVLITVAIVIAIRAALPVDCRAARNIGAVVSQATNRIVTEAVTIGVGPLHPVAREGIGGPVGTCLIFIVSIGVAVPVRIWATEPVDERDPQTHLLERTGVGLVTTLVVTESVTVSVGPLARVVWESVAVVGVAVVV